MNLSNDRSVSNLFLVCNDVAIASDRFHLGLAYSNCREAETPHLQVVAVDEDVVVRSQLMVTTMQELILSSCQSYPHQQSIDKRSHPMMIALDRTLVRL